ncbi:MAG: DUF2029 domain-containing protein [Acetobacteraceae bacterium]|nr:DUF2029 domain-containing protein [Acetobacteraceae bacterium]
MRRFGWNENWINSRRISAYPKIFLALYLVIGAAWVGLSTNLVDLKGKPLGYDFITFWAASDLALEGRPADAFNPARIIEAERKAVPANNSVFLWHYPPTFYLLVLPLALVPYMTACLIWIGGTLALYLGYMRRVLASPHETWLLLAFPGTFVNIFHGQNGFLSTVLIAAACLNLEKRPMLAGIMIGALSYKPHLGLLFPLALVAGRHWLAFAAAAVTTLLFCGFATLVFGTAGWLAFWDNLPLTRHILETGFLPWHKMPSVFAALRMLGLGVPTAYVVHALVACAVASLVVLAWHRRETPLALRSALLAVGALLISPYGFDYDLVILALPIALMAMDGLRNGWMPGMRTVLVVAWLTPLLLPMLAEKTSLQLMPVVLLGFFGMIQARLWAEPVGTEARRAKPVAAVGCP